MKLLSLGSNAPLFAVAAIALAIPVARKAVSGPESCSPDGTPTCSCGGLALLTPVSPRPSPIAPRPQGKWISIFNGKNLDGWTPKIKGYALGDNFANTFRVVNGAMQVNYDGYGGKFEGRFGHIFYKSKLKSYILRFEYRFTGDQIADGPGWAFRNSGAMLICQDPKTIRKDQDFPVSIEAQLLGGDGKGERPTGNVCTPGTNIVLGGKFWTQHCTNSTSPTFHGDQWVKAEFEVRTTSTLVGQTLQSATHIIHRINGKAVMEYDAPQLDPNDPDGKALIEAAKGEKTLSEGWISLQSESHPCEFRKIELMELR